LNTAQKDGETENAQAQSFLKEVLEAESENDFPFTKDSYGIDISNHQPNIDWEKTINSKFHGRKLEAVFIKATEGTWYTSPSYYKDSASASLYPQIKVKTTYHYFKTSVKGKDQAEYMVSVIEKDPHFNKDTDFYVIDVEENDPFLCHSEFALHLNAFIDVMESNGYKNAMIYTTTRFWTDHIDMLGIDIWKRARLWLARWGKDDGEIPSGDKWYTELPNGATKADVWQFTSVGHVDGIDEIVDLDLVRVDF
jgi:lysozyme